MLMKNSCKTCFWNDLLERRGHMWKIVWTIIKWIIIDFVLTAIWGWVKKFFR